MRKIIEYIRRKFQRPLVSVGHRAERLSAYATVAIAIFTLVSLATAIGTYVILKGQLDEIKKQYPELKKSADAAKSAADTASKTVSDNKGSFNQTLAEMQKQSAAMQKAADATAAQVKIGTESLFSVQRAFLFMRPPASAVIGTSKVETLNVSFEWENSGATPTKSMQTHVSYLWLSQPLPDNFQFPDLWTEGSPHLNTPGVVGPKGTVGIQEVDIPISAVEEFLSHRQHIYFWGWTRYQDIFKGTPTHLTEFCFELLRIKGNILSAIPTDITQVIFSNCPVHNCYEEGCQDYAARVKAN